MSRRTFRGIALATFLSGSILAESASAPAQPGQPIGLPRVRDYQPVPELRDVHFDFGSAVIRPDDVRSWRRTPRGCSPIRASSC
jgi:hypothetical protein